jgi:hypothetical protein
MILAATILLPFAMLGMVFTLAWIEDRYLTSGSDRERSTARPGVAAGPPPLRADPRVIARRRPGRHRAPGFLTGHAPPGRRVNPRRA